MPKTLLALALSAALAGCAAMGPDYERPQTPAPEQWRISIQQANDLANVRWWEQFQDPALNELIRIGLAENRDVNRTFAFRHSRVGGNPVSRSKAWIPAFAGMTNLRVERKSWSKSRRRGSLSLWGAMG